MSQSEEKNDPMSLETRFGLVMYGGVSLAIYINGVAQEFYRAVRGRGVYKLVKSLIDSDIVVDIISGTSAGGINGVMLAYALCNQKEFAEAGNLWRNDGDIRRLLRSPYEKAETSWSLLNSEGYYQPQLEAAFRGMEDIKAEVRQAELPSEFKELDLFVTGTDVDGRRFTQFDDAGHPIDVKDHRTVFLLKHRAERKEPFNPKWASRSLAPLQRKPDPEATFRALAKLSRITSCFPAAFSPVAVTKMDAGDEADVLLREWGMIDREACFLDGGLIDNKPFTYTLREIFYRPAERRIDRKLFYIEPDPEHWEEIVNASQPNFAEAIVASLIGIPGYESISDDLKLLASHNSRLQRYRRMVSFLDEKSEVEHPSPQSEQLYKQSRLIALSERIAHGIMRTGGRDELLDKETREAGAALIESFEKFIADSFAQIPESTPQQDAELQKLLSDLMPRIVQALLAAEGNQERQTREVAAMLGPFLEEYEKAKRRLRPQTEADRLLTDYDTDFRLRRLFRTVYFIEWKLRDVSNDDVFTFEVEGKDGAKEKIEVEKAHQYKKLWRLLNTQIQLFDIIRTAMEKVIDESDFDWKRSSPAEVWVAAEAVLKHFLDAKSGAVQSLPKDFVCSPKEDRPELMTSKALEDFNRAIRNHAEAIAECTSEKSCNDNFHYGDGRIAFPGKFKSFIRMIEECEAKMVAALLPLESDPVRRVYENFEALDAKLYPVELIAELNEKDNIKTFRISPFDARRGFSNRGLSDKVSGDALYHFGGFFKRSWRSNDILWGRLDCLCQLVETLLNAKRLRDILENARVRMSVIARFYETDPQDETKYKLRDELRPKELFPYAGGLMWDKWEAWLKDLLLEGDLSKQRDTTRAEDYRQARENALRAETLNEMVELLIEAAQLEIIKDDVPKVITDALEEQVGWNQFRIPRNGGPKSVGAQTADAQAAAGLAVIAQNAAASLAEVENPFVFSPPPADLDSFVGVFAAENRTKQWIEAMKPDGDARNKRPTDTRLGEFFKTKYKVGTEALTKDIPSLVLLEVLSVSLLVLRNCVLDIFGERAERIKSHPLYIAAIDWPLRALYLLVRFLRRAPRWEKQVFITLSGLSLLSLGLTIYRWDAMIMPNGNFSLVSFAIFVIAPALALNVFAFFLRGEHYLRRRAKPKQGGLKTAFQKVLKLVPLLTRAALALLPLGAILFLMWQFYSGANHVHLEQQLLKAGDVVPVDQVLLRPTGGGITGDQTFIAAGSFYPRWLIFACILALAGPFFAYTFITKLIDFRRGKERKTAMRADALREMLETYFSVAEMIDIGRRLLASKTFEWAEVSDLLKKRKESEVSGVKRRLEKAQASEKAGIEVELKEVEKAWDDKLSKLDQKFGSYKRIKWGNLRRFMEDEGWSDDLLYLAVELGIPQESEWPQVGDAPLRSAQPIRLRGLLFWRKPLSVEGWRREELARKLTDWAKSSDSLPALATRMRFVNPEALYGE